MNKVVVGMIGSGFAAGLHMGGYKKVYGVDVVIKAAAAGTMKEAEDFAGRWSLTNIDLYDDYRKLLLDEEIDVVDIVTPPNLHTGMVIDAMKAGKDVICEKPLTGYFNAGSKDNIGHTVKKADMYKKVMEDLEQLKAVVDSTGKTFMYAENWLYAPTVQKSAELITAMKNKILLMHAEEGHNGSHAEHAANWKFTGGGVLIRQGCHPISAVLYLKQVEAKARGEEITVKSVLCDVGVSTAALSEHERRFIDANPVDVEDVANLTITFSDGTKAHVMSGDMIVGGMRNRLDIYTNDGMHRLNMNPNDTFTAYHAEEKGLEDIYFAEKLGTKQGWQYVGIGEEFARGYAGEMQDFMECAAENRKPLADFRCAYDTARVMYAAYQSAEEGRRIEL